MHKNKNKLKDFQKSCGLLDRQTLTTDEHTGLRRDLQLRTLCSGAHHNNKVWVMLLNFVGTSHCGPQCHQSLCLHICLQLWSGRCPFNMPHIQNKLPQPRWRMKDMRHTPLLRARKQLGDLGLFFIQRRPHSHVLLHQDFNGKRGNQCKALMAVRHNLAVVALPVAHTLRTKRHTHINACKSVLKQSHSRTSQNNQKYQRYCRTLFLSACILILLLKSEEKSSMLNKYSLCLTHGGGTNQTHPPTTFIPSFQRYLPWE